MNAFYYATKHAITRNKTLLKYTMLDACDCLIHFGLIICKKLKPGEQQIKNIIAIIDKTK